MNKILTLLTLLLALNKLGNAQTIDYIPSGDHIYTDADYKDDARQLNTSLPVGTLPGNVNVNSDGAATYNIPIDIPSGIAGIEPALSIGYNSNWRNGNMGVGWNISGAGSAIYRDEKSKYIEGKRGKVNYNNSDAISLDGRRLIPINGNFVWDNGNVFVLEGDPDTKVVYNPSDGSWTVTQPTGKTLRYGSSYDSKASGSDVVLKWYLKTVSDLNGNTMVYNYLNDGVSLENRLTSINYTSNGSTEFTNKIVFSYGLRSDVTMYKTNKGLYKNSWLITSLRVEVKGELLWNYRFNYTKSDKGASALAEIIKENGHGVALNSTRFQWQQPKKKETFWTAFNTLVNEPGGFTGDFNGDGITDFFNPHWRCFLRTNRFD